MSISRIPTGGISARLPGSRAAPSTTETGDREPDQGLEDQLDLSTDWFDRIAPRVLLDEVLRLLEEELAGLAVDLQPLARERDRLRQVGELGPTAAALRLREVVEELRDVGAPLEATVESVLGRAVRWVRDEFAERIGDRHEGETVLRTTRDRMLAAVSSAVRRSG